MLVLGIETSTRRTSVALGGEQGTLAALEISRHVANHEMVTAAITRLCELSDVPLRSVGGIAVGLGPGLYTGMRVGIATGKTLAQALGVPIIGVASLDALALAVRHTSRRICAVIDARRGEVFAAFYRPVPGGVAREGEYAVFSPSGLAAELAARRQEVLLVGGGALVYRRELEEPGVRVEFASRVHEHPSAAVLVELAVPRFLREDADRLFDVSPIYLRKADAEITWDQRRGAG